MKAQGVEGMTEEERLQMEAEVLGNKTATQDLAVSTHAVRLSHLFGGLMVADTKGDKEVG